MVHKTVTPIVSTLFGNFRNLPNPMTRPGEFLTSIRVLSKGVMRIVRTIIITTVTAALFASLGTLLIDTKRLSSANILDFLAAPVVTAFFVGGTVAVCEEGTVQCILL